MKKYICFIVILFVFVNMSLFAFENEYFKVNDSKWSINNKVSSSFVKGFNGVYGFSLKDFETDDPIKKMAPPSIFVAVKKNEEGVTHYIKDEKGFLENQKKVVTQDFEAGEKRFKEAMLQVLLAQMPNTPKSRLEKMVDKEYEATGGSELGSIAYTRVGPHKAVESNYRLSVFAIRTYVIYTLTRIYYIEVKYYDSVEIDSLPAFKEFMSSLDFKDKIANKFNSETLPLLIKLGIGSIGLLIGIGAFIYVKKNEG